MASVGSPNRRAAAGVTRPSAVPGATTRGKPAPSRQASATGSNPVLSALFQSVTSNRPERCPAIQSASCNTRAVPGRASIAAARAGTVPGSLYRLNLPTGVPSASTASSVPLVPSTASAPTPDRSMPSSTPATAAHSAAGSWRSPGSSRVAPAARIPAPPSTTARTPEVPRSIPSVGGVTGRRSACPPARARRRTRPPPQPRRPPSTSGHSPSPRRCTAPRHLPPPARRCGGRRP